MGHTHIHTHARTHARTHTHTPSPRPLHSLQLRRQKRTTNKQNKQKKDLPIPGWADSGFLGLGVLCPVRPLAGVWEEGEVKEEEVAVVLAAAGESRISIGGGDDDALRMAWCCVMELLLSSLSPWWWWWWWSSLWSLLLSPGCSCVFSA